MKRIIVSVSIGEHTLYNQCVASHRRYAEELGVVYHLIDKSLDIYASHLYLNKLRVLPFLEQGFEVLFLDADVYVRPHSPNIFEVYKQDTSDIVALNEAQFLAIDYSAAWISQVFKKDVKAWPIGAFASRNYFNSGVMLLRPNSAKVFRHFDLVFFVKNIGAQHLYEQSYLNLLFVIHKVKITNLDLKFNHMFFAGWFSKEESHFIHYANINKSIAPKVTYQAAVKKESKWHNLWPDNMMGKKYYKSKNQLVKCSIKKDEVDIEIIRPKKYVVRYKNKIQRDAKNGILLAELTYGIDYVDYRNERFYEISSLAGILSLLKFNLLKTRHRSILRKSLKSKLSVFKFSLYRDTLFPVSWFLIKPIMLARAISGKYSKPFALQKITYLQRRTPFFKSLKKEGLRVQNGVFKNFKFDISSFLEEGSELFPKLIGTYESEISSDVSYFFNHSKYDVFVNIGCGEGYYLLNFAIINNATKIIGVDTSEKALKLLLANKKKNNVQKAIDLRKSINASELKLIGQQNHSGLILSDCEGFELELFDESCFASLKNFDIIIETHDFLVEGITEDITNAASKTHHIKVKTSIPDLAKPNLYDPLILSNDKYHERLNILSESRPDNMKWLILTPLNK